MKVADSLLDVLDAAGIDTLFGLPGSTEAALLEAIRARDYRYVLALHEGIAVSMADGYARVNGRPAAVGLHTSVGTLNGLSQMMNAHRDGSPVVVTAGHKDRSVLSEEGFCALPGLLSAAGSVTKWAHQSLTAEAVAFDLAHAIRVATAPPRGPVYLAVPEDLLSAQLDGRQEAPSRIVTAPLVSASPTADAVSAAGRLLRGAARPVLVVGGAARSAAEEVARLCRVAELPLLLTEFTDLSDVPVPTDGDHFVGLYGEDSEILEDCDLVVAAGCRVFYPFSDATRPRLPKGARLVHIHDDPSEIGRVTRADVALLGEPRLGIAALAEELERSGGLGPSDHEGRNEWLSRLRQRREERLAEEAKESQAAPGSPVRIDVLADVLHSVLPPDAIVAEEAVRSARALFRNLKVLPNQRVLRTSGGSLGWGVPAGVGAALAAPGWPVVAVVGDGSFNFSVQALWTAARCGVSMVIVVLDNGGYLAVKRAIERHLKVPHDPRMHPGTEIDGIDYLQVAKGYGANAASVTDPESLLEALRNGLSAGGLWVLHVPVAEVRP